MVTVRISKEAEKLYIEARIEAEKTKLDIDDHYCHGIVAGVRAILGSASAGLMIQAGDIAVDEYKGKQ